MHRTNGAPDGAADRLFVPGSIAWLASSPFGPRIAFAPDMGGGEGGGDAGADAGSAAPEPVSARDSVMAAFAQLDGQPDQGQPPAQEGQKALTPDARARDEQGRFAAAQAGGQEGKPQAQTGQQPAAPAKGEQQNAQEGQPAAQEGLRPPPGWSVASKEAYAGLPDSVKQDIAKREQEVNAGLAELREYRDLRPYRDYAQRHGTTIPAVIDQVKVFEDTLQRDPVSAIGGLSQLYGFNLPQVVTAIAQRIGMTIGAPASGEGNAPPAAAQQPQPMQLPPEIVQRLAQVDQLQAHIQGQQQAQMQGAIETFASDPANEFFENVAPQMQQIIASNIGHFRAMPPHQAIKEAYDQAVWLNPETRAALINRQAAEKGQQEAARLQAATHQARQASKGLSGTPVNGATPGSAQPTPKTTRDAAAAAFDMHASI